MKFKDGGLHKWEWDGAIRLHVGDDLFRSEVCKVQDRVFRRADEWRAEALTKGWLE
jgi:hypothetical protein